MEPPFFSSPPYLITDFFSPKVSFVDKSHFPYKYQLEGLEGKFFYEFNLLPQTTASPRDSRSTTNQEPILVQSVDLSSSPSLRSGTQYARQPTPTYTILKERKIERVTAPDLELYKKLFGSSVLAYGPFFSNEKYTRYII